MLPSKAYLILMIQLHLRLIRINQLPVFATRGQCYKTFYGRNLRIFEAFPAYSIACGQGQEPNLEWGP
jgi:hypothetical protein